MLDTSKCTYTHSGKNTNHASQPVTHDTQADQNSQGKCAHTPITPAPINASVTPQHIRRTVHIPSTAPHGHTHTRSHQLAAHTSPTHARTLHTYTRALSALARRRSIRELQSPRHTLTQTRNTQEAKPARAHLATTPPRLHPRLSTGLPPAPPAVDTRGSHKKCVRKLICQRH